MSEKEINEMVEEEGISLGSLIRLKVAKKGQEDDTTRYVFVLGGYRDDLEIIEKILKDGKLIKETLRNPKKRELGYEFEVNDSDQGVTLVVRVTEATKKSEMISIEHEIRIHYSCFTVCETCPFKGDDVKHCSISKHSVQ